LTRIDVDRRVNSLSLVKRLTHSILSAKLRLLG
jgi:hypothetical protein